MKKIVFLLMVTLGVCSVSAQANCGYVPINLSGDDSVGIEMSWEISGGSSASSKVPVPPPPPGLTPFEIEVEYTEMINGFTFVRVVTVLSVVDSKTGVYTLNIAPHYRYTSLRFRVRLDGDPCQSFSDWAVIP